MFYPAHKGTNVHKSNYWRYSFLSMPIYPEFMHNTAVIKYS